MADCAVCGKRLGFGVAGTCNDCVAKERTDAQLAQREQARADRDASERAFVAYSGEVRRGIDAVTAVGGTAYLHRSEYIPVDSVVEQIGTPLGLDLRAVGALGAQGWEVVGIVPRTFSDTVPYFAKSRLTARDWGGQKIEQLASYSGNVVGVYVLLRLPITAATRTFHDAAIEPACRSIIQQRGVLPVTAGEKA